MSRRAVCHAVCVCVAAALTSCIAFPNVRDTSGRSVRLPWDQLAQINRLASARRDIRQPVTDVRVLSADRAEVSSRRADHTGDPVTVFTIRKRGGQWHIEEGSVRQTKVVITS